MLCQGEDGTAHTWAWQGPCLEQAGAQEGILMLQAGIHDLGGKKITVLTDYYLQHVNWLWLWL